MESSVEESDIHRCLELNTAAPEPLELNKTDEMVLYYIARTCSAAAKKNGERYKWKMCDKLLRASEEPEEWLRYLITVKNVGGLRFPSSAMYCLANVTLTIFQNIRKTGSFSNTSTEGNLISLMIAIIRQRLQFEPTNCVENLFDCTSSL